MNVLEENETQRRRGRCFGWCASWAPRLQATALLSVMAKWYPSVVSNMLLEEVNCEERNKLNV